MKIKNPIGFCEKIRREVGMDKAHYVESNGIRGGLVLWWREESTIDVLYQDRNIIDCKTTLGNHARMIHITWVYGNLIFEQILKNWEPLRRMGRGKNSPWILMISVLTTKKPGVKKHHDTLTRLTRSSMTYD